MSFPVGTISSSAGGAIAVDTALSSSYVQSAAATQWASFAARYQQYRVRAVKVTFKAKNPVQSATVIHGNIFFSDFIGSSTPSSAAQVLADERAKVFDTYSDIMYEADWSRNPNSRLWNPTSAAVPTANLFGVAFASGPGALSVSIGYFECTVEWLVELRGAQ